MCQATHGHSPAPEDHGSHRQTHAHNSGFSSVSPSKPT